MHVIASIILPSSSQLWAEATSSLNGVSTVCSRDSTFQLLPYARYRRFRRCPDKVRLSAARGDLCEMLREANPLLIPKQQRQSTVAPFMQPALRASSAVLPATSSLSLSLSPAARLASTRTTQLALLQRAPSTIICSRSACCSSCCMRMHPPDAAIRAASLSPRPQAVQHLHKCLSLPSSRLLCLSLNGAASCARKATPAWTLRQFNCRCHFSSPTSLAVSYWKTSTSNPIL